MKRFPLYCFLLFSLGIFAISCSKEISFETGGTGTAVGSLTDSTGNCKNSEVKGEYEINTQLNDSNYVKVNVLFSSIGKYKIYSDTVNGMWFADSGFNQITGAAVIRLKGKGMPLSSGTADFVLHYGTSKCNFSVTTGGPNNGSSATDYLPVTEGGWIRYGLDPALPLTNGGSLDTFRTTVTNITTTFNGNLYRLYETTPTYEALFFSKTNNKYLSKGTPEFDLIYVYDTIVNNATIEYEYLRANAAVGETWESPALRAGASNGTAVVYGQAKLKFTILANNETATYLGLSFNNIIRLKREMWFQPDNGNNQVVLFAEISYARGIGMLEQKIYSPVNGQNVLVQRMYIKGYNGL
ncbi:MAG TPA: hypothetical protein VJ552_04675 [Sediminibacterium sp.]|nr:hypothetical protein [Sediminibacterium sp.]